MTCLASCDRGQDVDAVAGGDLRPLLAGGAVDEDVDVLADAALLVEHPAEDRRVRTLEREEHVADRRAVDVVLAPSAELRERRAQPHLGHSGHPKQSISTL